jgi:hypothetical protein
MQRGDRASEFTITAGMVSMGPTVGLEFADHVSLATCNVTENVSGVRRHMSRKLLAAADLPRLAATAQEVQHR